MQDFFRLKRITNKNLRTYIKTKITHFNGTIVLTRYLSYTACPIYDDLLFLSG